MIKRYEHTDGTGVVAFAGIYSHLWNLQIDSAVVSVMEAAFPDVKQIMGGDLPSNVQGLLGCWSWVETINSQVCLLMEHAKDENGYFIAHELAHLLHYSIRPELFNNDLRHKNLTEMVAHAVGLSFAPFAQNVKTSVDRLEDLKRDLHDDFFLERHYFSAAERYSSGREHNGGNKAAEFILFQGIDIRRFVALDATEAERELAKLGYSNGLYIEPKRRKRSKPVDPKITLD